MTNETRELLEFDTVLTELGQLSISPESVRELETGEGLVFFSDSERLSKQLDAVVEVRRIIQDSENFPYTALPDISGITAITAKEGAVLDPQDLNAVAAYLLGAAALSRAIGTRTGNEHLGEICSGAPDCTELVRAIRRVLDETGEIRIENIPELRRIRDHSARAQKTLEAAAMRILRSGTSDDRWTGNLPVQRDGRTVLPLAAKYRGGIQGILHETSGTGRTVYVEPIELIEQNNMVIELEDRFRRELHRILKDLTRQVRERTPEITRFRRIVAQLDRFCAAARYAIRHECNRAEITEKEVRLVRARHPLLGKNVVPISLDIADSTRTLVITGPNTGGKTVGLKTLGLFCLMHQFGLEVPVDPGTRLPICDRIFVDIGDDQSIEKSLSTFSGHMRRIAEVLENAGPRSLVLLDELGSGTDPAEGAALAMAILDELEKTGSLVVITTHNGGLKQYAYRRPDAENASVEFNDEMMAPTYRIVPGVPGGSHAIEIAERSGVPVPVLEAARRYLNEGAGETEKIIAALEKTRSDLAGESRDLEERRSRLEAQDRELADLESELNRRELEMRRGTVRELEQFGAETRKTLENLVRELREGEISREKTRKVKEFIQRTGDRLAEERAFLGEQRDTELTQKNRPPARKRRGKPGVMKPGVTVKIQGATRTGTVERRNRDGTWVVTVGGVRLNLSETDLEIVSDGPERGASVSYKPVVTVEHPNQGPLFQLDLRGFRLEEAIQALEKHLDRCIVEEVFRFGVIHGTGEGVLQKGVRQYLADMSGLVKSFEYAASEDGGFGKTIVTLAESHKND